MTGLKVETRIPVICYELVKNNVDRRLVGAGQLSIINNIRKRKINSILGLYLVKCRSRGYAVIPLFLDKLYSAVQLSIKTLVNDGYLRKVKCEPIEYDYAKANRILAKTEGFMVYKNNIKVPVKKADISTVPTYLLTLLLNKFLVPREGWWGIDIIYKNLDLLNKEGRKYYLKPESVIKIVEELRWRVAKVIDLLAEKSLVVGFDLGYITNLPPSTPKSTTIVSKPRTIHFYIRYVKKMQNLKVKFKEINDLAEVLHTLINLIDDWWIKNYIIYEKPENIVHYYI